MPIDELLDEYWDLAYAEGQRGATTDTPSGDAQRVRSALSAAIERLLAERDEAREAWRQAQAALEPFWGPWVTHRGYHDPDIPGNALVTVLFRDNGQAIGRMHDWDQNWQWADDEIEHPGHIIMYRTIVARQALEDSK